MSKRAAEPLERVGKKQRGEVASSSHPSGVAPLGNLYFASNPTNSRDVGLGLLGLFQDDILLYLLGEVSAFELGTLSLVSKAFYLFCEIDLLWRDLFLCEFQGDFQFESTWKTTYLKKKTNKVYLKSDPLKVQGLYSDVIYNAWYCAQINPYRWAKLNNIQRRENLSVEEFKQKYENPGVPVIISDIVPSWPAFQKWNNEYLNATYGSIPFKTDQLVDVRLQDYLQYADNVVEERPIYLFCNEFCERAPQMRTEYSIPPYFTKDYFSYIEKDRPSYRWLLVGPTRAGATFHKDPNWTSAWNGLISGKKKWLFYPPDTAPLGVIPSDDGLQVTVPSTMVQWFMDFYPQKPPVKPIECIQNPGDLVFVPSGWWHSVINLEPSVALTQNYVSDTNLRNVFRFLKSKKNLGLSDEFCRVLHKNCPEIYQSLLEEIQETNTWEEEVDDGENWVLG